MSSSDRVVIKSYRRKYYSLLSNENDKLFKSINLAAFLDGEEVGALRALQLDIPEAYARGDVYLVGDMMDEDEELSELCSFAFGKMGLFLGEHLGENPSNHTFTKEFAEMAKPLFYEPPMVTYDETDFDYKLIYVSWLKVSEAHRGLGIGSKLMAALGRRNAMHRHNYKATYIALKAYPFEGQWKSLPEKSEERIQCLKDETVQLKSFYQKLGFSTSTDTHWMLNCPNNLYVHVRAQKMALETER